MANGLVNGFTNYYNPLMIDIAKGKGLFWLGSTLAIGLIFSTSIAGNVVRDIKVRDRTISVKGYATKPIQADMASWFGEFKVRGVNLVDTSKIVEKNKARVRDYLDKGGFDATGTNFLAPSVAILYKQDEEGRNTHAIESYIVEQSFYIQSRDVKLVKNLSTNVGVLLEDGLEFTSRSPVFKFTKLEDWKLILLKLARQNAKQRADILVGEGGVNVGDVRSASQGVFQITRWDDTKVTSYGTNDTTAIDKNICAVVTMEYELR